MKLAIVTGGSRGLGAAICAHYEQEGWRVLEFSRSAPYDYSVRVDLSDPTAAGEVLARRLTSMAARDFEEIVAIGNAAVLGPVGPAERSAPAQIAAHIDTNILSGILFARALVAAFQEHDCPKTFVNVSSGAAASGLAGWSLYCASKAAMENFVRAVSLEQEARRHPIRAINVNPGVMDTAMQERVRNSSIEDFPDVERFKRYHEQGRLADPAAVAARVAEIVASRPEPGETYSAKP